MSDTDYETFGASDCALSMVAGVVALLTGVVRHALQPAAAAPAPDLAPVAASRHGARGGAGAGRSYT